MKTVFVLGCDGYIGHPLTLRLLDKGYKVVGLDNFQRRVNVEFTMNSYSAIPIESINERVEKYKSIGDFTFHDLDIAKSSYKNIKEILKKYQPDTIVNLAHQPSGPFSMIDRDYCMDTTLNNLQGTINLLWGIKEECPECHYITIGSTGEYDHNLNIDIEEGKFCFEHNGRMSCECIYPRRPTSFYHASKVANTYYIDAATRWWDLKTTDIQQSIVFGIYTKEIEKYNSPTRLDSDEAFGTVLNRFLVQASLEIPLTVYGEGKHQRGFIALTDSIQALEIAINNPPKKGEGRQWNQLSETISMNDLATMVKDCAKEIGIDIQITHVDSPRKEITTDHYYNYKTEKLRALGFRPESNLYKETYNGLVILSDHKDHIQNLKGVVMPKIQW